MKENVKKCLANVCFEYTGKVYTYYNDSFALKEGDIVFVEGKLEGKRGKITKLIYDFKIKLSDYKRIIALADMDVSGELCIAGSNFIAFDETVIPAEKVRSWFLPPADEEEDVVAGEGGEPFELKGLKGMDITDEIFEKGRDYYEMDRVAYLSLSGEHGYALVRGGETYEVEFKYSEGKIHSIVCNCYCGGHCKHEVAALLQLSEMLARIEKDYPETFAGYFAAMPKPHIYDTVINARYKGSIRV